MRPSSHVPHLTAAALVASIVLLAGTALLAQDKPQPPAPPAAVRESVPLQVQVVIARYQNDKRVSSLPFSLSVASAPGSKANVRMGSDVCVPAMAGAVNCNFRNVGTNIDVGTVAGSDNRMGLVITISETTLQPAESSTATGPSVPTVRSYQSSNTVYVKDGETAQFTAATDRLSGEVVRIEVTAKVVK
jgi:hypothetical protein